MSGGYFDHSQYRIKDIIIDIESILLDDSDYNMKEETIQEFKKGLEYLYKAYVYTQRIDWFLSGDDSEETFHERLKEDLNKLQQLK